MGAFVGRGDFGGWVGAGAVSCGRAFPREARRFRGRRFFELIVFTCARSVRTDRDEAEEG